MSPETLLETLRLHGKSSVCLVEPRDAREWAEVVAALLAVQRYTPTPSPTPAAVEAVDRTLELAARIVELEQEVARLKDEAATDGPTYNSGRAEGRADVAVALRRVVDPTDANHWSLSGCLAEVSRLREEVARARAAWTLLEQTRKGWEEECDETRAENERLTADVMRLKAPQSVTQEVLVANLGRCGFCCEEKPAAELVNGECADRAACARGVQAAAGGAR